MKGIALAAAAALLLVVPALADTSAPGKKGLGSRGSPGKAQAPVSITATLAPGRAVVTVRFRTAATDAAVEVHGVDGLTVTSAANPLSGGRFAAGQSVTLDVAFTEPPGRSNLAVGVTGTFAGAKRSSIVTFSVGQPTDAQRKGAESATTDSAGQRIKVMPADTR